MSIAKLTRYGLPFAAVAAASVTTNQITPGRTIENIQLKLGGTSFTKAMISSYKLKANGKVIVEGDGTTLDKLNAYKGQTTDAAYLDIAFADLVGMTEFDRAVGSLDTNVGIANMTQEVTIGAATAPTLLTILTESGAQKGRDGAAAPFAGVMSKILRYPYQVATGGKLPITLPFGRANGAIIKRVHVSHANMTGATVKQDSLVIHESLRLENEYEQKRWGRVPQAGVYCVDFVVDGNMFKALDTRDARSLEWLFDFSAADNGNVTVEYLDVLGNL